jgi:hypothetical protein
MPNQFDSTPFIKQIFDLLSRKDRRDHVARTCDLSLGGVRVYVVRTCARITAHTPADTAHDMTHNEPTYRGFTLSV